MGRGDVSKSARRFVLCKLCLPYMQKGAIVNVSSVHAHETTPNVIPYTTNKGGMETFSHCISSEFEPSKVRVNSIEPGAVDTPMLWNNQNVKNGIEKWKTPSASPKKLRLLFSFWHQMKQAYQWHCAGSGWRKVAGIIIINKVLLHRNKPV